MKTYQTSININASSDNVWRVLTHTMPSDPTPFGILKLQGQIALGAKIKLWSEVAPERAFTLKVVTFDPPHKMIWRGGMPFGLFTGTRTFTLTSSSTATQFHMSEVFSGPLSGMITKSMPDLTSSFEKFAQALKSASETS